METQHLELPIFGNVVLKYFDIPDWEYKYETYLRAYVFGEITIDISVYFKELSDNYISKVRQVLTDIQKINEIATTAYISDYHNGSNASDYIQEWHEDIFKQIFSDDEFHAFLAQSDESVPVKERLLSLLRLVGIGIYAGADENFIVMDYAFGYDIEKGFRDDMLVVKINERYDVTEITNEG